MLDRAWTPPEVRPCACGNAPSLRSTRTSVRDPNRTMPMNAQLSALQQQAQQLSESVTRPIPGSRKIFVPGSRPDLQVPMREIALTRTPTLFGGEENPPVTVYDTSGPYTDPEARIDLSTGLPALRARWIEERGDTEPL